jgi:hypothetical protein
MRALGISGNWFELGLPVRGRAKSGWPTIGVEGVVRGPKLAVWALRCWYGWAVW